MPHFDDLTRVEYGAGVPTYAVGWLDAGRAYAQGDVSRQLFGQLAALLINPWQPFATAGLHLCPLCRFTGGPRSVQWEGTTLGLGAAVLFVPSEHRLYVAPSLILHYVDAHAYTPPTEFVTAVASCPPMRSLAYLKRLRALGVSVRP